MTTLYHATPLFNLESIGSEGLRARSYWTDDLDMLDYYVETVEDDEQEAAVLCVNSEALIRALKTESLEPDYPGIEEPISGVLRKEDHEILEQWSASTKGWQDSLRIIRTMRCVEPIPAALISVLEPLSDEHINLSEYLRIQKKRQMRP